MVTSRKPAAVKPPDKSVDLEKKADKKGVATQKTAAKGSAEKRTEKTSEMKTPPSASTTVGKGTKAAKPAATPADNKKKKAATTQPAGRRTSTKPESPRADRPTSAWPFPSSDPES